MRKLTLLASTAIAALAIAVMAAPAQADRPFQLQDQQGAACNPCHEEFDGTVTLDTGEIGGVGTCDVRFDAYIYGDGWFETANTDVTGCTSVFAGTQACDDSWEGQGRLPNQGAFQVNMEACFDTSGSSPQENYDITYRVVPNSPGVLAWDMISASAQTPSLFDVTDSYLVDVNEEDLVLVLL